MSKGFLKNETLLNETYETEDLLDFSNIKKTFKGQLENIGISSLIGLIGQFGTGKSTMLFQLAQESEASEKWIFFDAWKFPERNNLWEGFVLDFVKSVDTKLFDRIRKRIDGQAKSDIKLLIKTLFQAVNIFVPGAAIGANLASLFQSSPARRVFEFQEILEELINKHLNENIKTLVVIVEDIDRSGDKGIFFLETLRQFIKNHKLEKSIKVIVPIGDKNFTEDKDSYLKSLDYIYRFEPKGINFSHFIEKIFDENSFKEKKNHWIKHVNYFLQVLLQNKNITIRELKNILRNANIRFASFTEQDRSLIDSRVFLVFAVADYFQERLVSLINGEKRLDIPTIGWSRHYLALLSVDIEDVSSERINFPIVYDDNAKFIFPKFWEGRVEREPVYLLSSKYIKLYE